MTRFRRTLYPTLLTLLFALALPLSASSPAPGRQIWDNDDNLPSNAAFHYVECTVLEVREGRMLVVQDEQQRQHTLTIPESAQIRAQSKKDFDGQKKLEFAQLKVGQRLKLTLDAEKGGIVRLTVLRAA